MITKKRIDEISDFISKKVSLQRTFILQDLYQEFGTSDALYFLLYFLTGFNNIDESKFIIPVVGKVEIIDKFQEIYEYGFMKINSCSSFFKECIECKKFFMCGPFCGGRHVKNNAYADEELMDNFFDELFSRLVSNEIELMEKEIDLFYGV